MSVGPAAGAGAADVSGAAAAPSSAADSRAPAAGLDYVALGDSYAAGFGLGDPTGRPVGACAQSAEDYPHRVATALDLDLTDVSCSSATTANVVDTRQSGAAPQVDALGPSTRIVTVSIGGNDADVFGTAASCIALGRTGPVFDAKATTRSCRETLDARGDDTLARAIDSTTATGLRRAFTAIRAEAPNARVFVVGYPAVFPDAAHTPASGCFRPVIDGTSLSEGLPRNGFPFTDVDVAYLSGVQAHLDTVLKRAAAAASFTYVDTLPGSQAHSACSRADPYIEGVSLVASAGFTKISLEPGALHPNARGAAYLADQTAAAITRSLASTPSAGAGAGTGAGAGVAAGLPVAVWLALGLGLALIAAAIVALLVARRRRGRPAPDPRDTP
jgi:lysophospholipase L1-like esterase